MKDPQLGLPFGTPPHKLVRAQGPDTSVEAAEKVDSAGLERRVYEVICSFGDYGCTSDAVRSLLPALPYSSVTARFSALIAKGLIVDTEKRRPGNSGRSQRVMRKA